MMVQTSLAGHLNAKQRVQLLMLPPAKRRRMLGQMGRQIIRGTRRRLKAQRDLNAAPWAPRKKGAQKMLRKLGRRLVSRPSERKVDVTFSNATVARIANAHQKGLDEFMTAEKMRRIHGEPDYDAPATRKQAKALRAEGYKIRRANGKGWKPATLKYIQENLTLGQAGVILRHMREKTETKKSWVIPLPERAFLGANEQEIASMTQTIFDQTINAKGARR